MIQGPGLFANGQTSETTEDSVQRQGSENGAAIWVISVWDDDGSWAAGGNTIKVAGRTLGSKADGATTYPDHISVKNRDTETYIDGDTGITVPGVYEVNLAGLEARIEHTHVAGRVRIREQIVLG